MTFDEWYYSEAFPGYYNQRDYEIMKLAWNAAKQEEKHATPVDTSA